MKARVKKIKIPAGMSDQGISDMFNQMLGAGNVNITIAYPRYVKMKNLCGALVTVFEKLANSPFMRLSAEFSKEKREIDAFCTESRNKIAELFTTDLSEYEWNLTLVDDKMRDKFNVEYDAIKKSDLVNTFIIMCDRLVKYKKYYVENSNCKFIHNMPGIDWSPLPFTSLNIKYIFSLEKVGQNTINFFMVVLAKAYELSYSLYTETQTPDIDIDQFVDVIMVNIDAIQQQPELHRCKRAFQKIKESVSLLKGRFNNYYRDFIITKDSTIMMQHFITDVAKQTDADPQVTAEFRRIIAYYRKIAQNHVSDPKVKMMIDKISDSLKTLERGTENLVGIVDGSDDDSGDDSGDDSNYLRGENTAGVSAVEPSDDDKARQRAALKTVDELVSEIEGPPSKSKKEKKKRSGK